jgi:ABC-2 type transport system permease protein
MFLALGLFVSSLVKSQLVAWMAALLLGLVFVLPALLRWWFESGSMGYSAVYFVSVPEHFRRTFTRGQLDTRPLILYLSVTLFCLFMTVRSLEARRLR